MLTSELKNLNNIMWGMKKIVRMNVKPRDRVLVISNFEQQAFVNRALAMAAEDAGADSVVIAIYREYMGKESPKQIVSAAKSSNVIFHTATTSYAFTTAVGEAIKAGARIVLMGLTPEQFSQGAITADYGKVHKLTVKLARILSQGKKAHVTSEFGTDIRFDIGRDCLVLDGVASELNGFFVGGGTDGEAMLAPMEGTAEGTVIVDGTILVLGFGEYNEKTIGLLREPVKLSFKNGRVIKVSGGAQAKKFAKILNDMETRRGDKNAKMLAEFAIGTNPNARFVSGHEDKKRLGTIHFALGHNQFGSKKFSGKLKSSIHIDMVIKDPTVAIDDKIIMEKGKLLV